MNREIKFKVWCPEIKEFINQNDFVVRADGVVGILNHSSVKDKILWTSLNRFKLIQFTGRQDKDGNDLYEGDILKIYHFTTGKKFKKNHYIYKLVIFHDGAFKYQHNDGEVGSLLNVIQNEFTVCGNIFENPELL